MIIVNILLTLAIRSRHVVKLSRFSKRNVNRSENSYSQGLVITLYTDLYDSD